MGQMSTKFDFLRNLYNTNEQAFNEYREEVVSEFINTLPTERAEKMRQFQLSLSDDLGECETSEERMVLLGKLMEERSEVFQQSIDKLKALVNK